MPRNRDLGLLVNDLRQRVAAGRANGGPARRNRPRSPSEGPRCAPILPPVPLFVMTITGTITVAEGVFAPRHLGELTRIGPFEPAAAAGHRFRRGGRRV